MPEAGNMELVRDYHRHGSEAAFAELVRRHVHLVYSVAVRHVGVAAHAEEITQAVFIILARKAAGLRPDTILEGWLHETARLTALSFLRGDHLPVIPRWTAVLDGLSIDQICTEVRDLAGLDFLAPLVQLAIIHFPKFAAKPKILQNHFSLAFLK
jgi:DNA-directed RNA polymerase specialized sigma24 family protein